MSMADDGGARDSQFSIEGAAPIDRRGPLRPERLQSARKRLAGASVVRLFQVGDILGLVVATLLTAQAAPADATLLIAAAVVTLMLLLAFGAYRMGTREPLWRRYGRTFSAIVASGIALGVLAQALKAPDPWRLAASWTAASGAVISGLHMVWGAVLGHLRRKGLLTPNIIIVGATATAERLIQNTLRQRDVNILGIFDDRKDRVGPSILGVPILGVTADLLDHRVLPFVDRIVVTVPEQARGRVAQLIERLSPIPNPISLLLDGDSPADEARAVGRIADFGLTQIFGAPQRKGYQVAKRALDLTVGLAAAAALAPLFVMIALAIRLDSPGPIFFRQRRYGYLNEEILVWKFRSMRADAADAHAHRQVAARDDRVTRIGRFLRKSSLDELPQILNVIRGEMSLVGPRPHAIGMLTDGADASKLVETYAHRHRIRPGLTGWAAVNGSRGPVDTPEAVRRRVALDLQYVEHQSLWLDIAIMLRTLPCLLGDTAAVR